ncbi:hypothetical protein [Streptomyces sp. ISL-21]|uniref:hypothetical protein n=1 Tax=Streptomyces sp. ISL-21 TaxID=2819179 RepID=UPI001BEC95A8|nr:hypothetical protein [Streptomyces sp. ISL-21]MBT2404852.1 hypothetical protein [Streptomyces sp. ISL-21]
MPVPLASPRRAADSAPEPAAPAAAGDGPDTGWTVTGPAAGAVAGATATTVAGPGPAPAPAAGPLSAARMRGAGSEA